MKLDEIVSRFAAAAVDYLRGRSLRDLAILGPTVRTLVAGACHSSELPSSAHRVSLVRAALELPVQPRKAARLVKGRRGESDRRARSASWGPASLLPGPRRPVQPDPFALTRGAGGAR